MAPLGGVMIPRPNARMMIGAGLAAAALLGATATTADARLSCGGKKATMVGSNGRDVIRAPKHGVQVIVARGGDDRIFAKGGHDVICAGPGDDVIFAGDGKDKVRGQGGDDYIDGGASGDKLLDGGGGADTIIGGGGGDKVKGGGDGDRILGGIQDDDLSGGSGSDVVVGGQGTDRMTGGSGDDHLRGDTNVDAFIGQGGSDTASFATATPPGYRDTGGVYVNLAKGEAWGEGHEPLRDIENVIGSPFEDNLYGRGGSGSVVGGLGSDTCELFANTCAPHVPKQSYAYIAEADSLDPGLVVYGTGANDTWQISPASGGIRISGTALQAADSCTGVTGGTFCKISPAQLGYILVWGGDGNDSISFRGRISPATEVYADGGVGSDVLSGSNNADTLSSGQAGSDRVYGRGGEDALFSRGLDQDQLFGGPGSDNLATDNPCGNHYFSGGSGHGDVAGFANIWYGGGIQGRIGGRATRGSCKGTSVLANNEVLEGTRFEDALFALRRTDLLIGKEGHDLCVGGKHKTC
jgi:hypothetical protein